ncbi:MAG: CPBP family intramembrane metalloprotease, partial [Oscillospiraceae bacterium]|nr:CPBP family intramembrane metalloprotease [Oscillospiraceae bacterium]
IINPDEHSAEVAALQHEIYRLNREIDQKNAEIIKYLTADKDAPFENPTDFKEFSGSYADVQPRLGEPGYKLTLEPDAPERKNLRRFYSIGGWCMIFQFAASFLASVALVNVIQLIMKFLNPGTDGFVLYNYLYGSSVLVALNMVIYLVCNVSFTFIGMKWAGYKNISLIRTKDYSFGKAIQYCLIALFIWTASVYLGSFVETVLNKFDLTSITNQDGLGESPLGLALGTLYTCIIAPITEEMMFRGMLLKVFSKANQRFAIFASAIFFGLAHGNIPQFILAFLLGIFMAHITMRHNSIIPSITVHIFINSFSTIFSSFSDKGEMLSYIATIVLFGASIFGMVMLFVFRSDGNVLPSPTPYQSRRGASTALSSLPFCAAAAIQIVYMAYR